MLSVIALAAYDIGSGLSDAVAPILGTPIGEQKVQKAKRVYKVI